MQTISKIFAAGALILIFGAIAIAIVGSTINLDAAIRTALGLAAAAAGAEFLADITKTINKIINH